MTIPPTRTNVELKRLRIETPYVRVQIELAYVY